MILVANSRTIPLFYYRSAAGSFKILKIFFGLQAEHTPRFSAVVCFVG